MRLYSLLAFFSIILITSGILFKEFGIISEDYDPADHISEISNNLASELRLVENQMQPVLEYLENQRTFTFTEFNRETKYPFYVYRNSRLSYWSDFRFIPEYQNLTGEYDKKFVRFGKSGYMVRKWKVNQNDSNIEVFALVNLITEPEIQNQYLSHDYNKDIFDFPDLKLSTQQNDGWNITLDDQFLFSVNIDIQYSTFRHGFQGIGIALFLAGLLLALVVKHKIVSVFTQKRKFGRAFIMLVLSLVATRALMLIAEFPNAYANLILFDSKLFASSELNPSIGDLFLNTLVVFIIVLYLFRNYHKSPFFVKALRLKNYQKVLISMLLITAGFYSLYYHYFIFQSIYNNSQWSLDITNNLHFPVSKIIFYIIFILNASIFFLVYHILFRVISKLTHRSVLLLILSFSLGALFWILTTIQTGLPLAFFVVLNLCFFFMLHFLKLPRFLIQLRYLAFLYLFISAIISASIGAYSIFNFEERNLFEDKIRFTNQFLLENDHLAELLLSEIEQEIKEDPLITSRIYSPFLSKEMIAQKVKSVYLGNYFDKYDIQVYLYNADGQPFETESTIADFHQIKRTFGQEQYKTDFPNLYFVNRIGGDGGSIPMAASS